MFPLRIPILHAVRRWARSERRREVKHDMFLNWIAFVQTRIQREEGQTMAEYGVVLGVITLLCIAAFVTLGGEITGVINRVVTRLKGA